MGNRHGAGAHPSRQPLRGFLRVRSFLQPDRKDATLGCDRGERSMDWKKKVLLIGAVLAAAAFVWLQFFGAEQPM